MMKNYLLSFFFFLFISFGFAQDKSKEPVIRIFPNPVNNVFTIEHQHIEIIRVEIYSLIGLKERDIINNYELINVSELPKGIYMVKIHTAKGHFVKKLIKN